MNANFALHLQFYCFVFDFLEVIVFEVVDYVDCYVDFIDEYFSVQFGESGDLACIRFLTFPYQLDIN